MKRCPQCNNRYPDQHVFCAEDGTTLLAVPSGPASNLRPLTLGAIAVGIALLCGVGMLLSGHQSRNQAAENDRLAGESRASAEQAGQGAQTKDVNAGHAEQNLVRAPVTQDVTPKPSTLPSTSAALRAWSGEKYPQTRSRLLAESDISNWSFEQTRYALNEMYARHGYDFQTPAIRRQFYRYEWYRRARVPGRSQAQAESLFDAIEAANRKLLIKHRDQLGSHPES